jgi:hypothetical protein
MHVAKPARHSARATMPAAALLPEQQQAGRATLVPTCQPTLPSRHLSSGSPSSPVTSISIDPDSTRRRRRRPPPPNAVATAAPSANRHPFDHPANIHHHHQYYPRRQREHTVYRASNCIRLNPITVPYTEHQYQIPIPIPTPSPLSFQSHKRHSTLHSRHTYIHPHIHWTL